ncbi:MAG: hypothetical protein V2G41_09345 [bacterium JZ-2024 1]
MAYLLEMNFPDIGQRFWASAPGIRWNGVQWDAKLIDLPQLRLRLDSLEQDRASLSVHNLEDDVIEIIETDKWRGAWGILRVYFYEGDFVKEVFRGIMASPRLNVSKITFELVSPFDPAVKSLPTQAVQQRCRVTQFGGPYGSLCPYGRPSGETGRVIGQPAADFPSVSSSQTTISVPDASRILIGDSIRLDSEIITVTQISGNTLTVSRGQFDTTPSAHSPQPGYFFTCPRSKDACIRRGMFPDSNEHKWTISSIDSSAKRVTLQENPAWDTNRWVVSVESSSNLSAVGYPVIIWLSNGEQFTSRVVSNDAQSLTLQAVPDPALAVGRPLAIAIYYFAGFPFLEAADLSRVLIGTLGGDVSDPVPEQGVIPLV